MKRSSILLISFTVLIAVITLLLLNDRWSTVTDPLTPIKPGQSEQIDRLFFYTAIDTFEFERRKDGWYFDDEKLNDEAVENVLIAAPRLVQRSMIPVVELPGLSAALEIGFISKKKEIGRISIVHSQSGSFVIPPESDLALGIELPGFEHQKLEKIFSPQLNHYRKHLLLDLLPSEVRSILVNPLRGTSFKVIQDSLYNLHVLKMPGLDDFTGEVKDRKMRLLFTYCSGIRYTGVLQDEGAYQSLAGRKADASLEIIDSKGSRLDFDIFEWVKEGKTEPDKFEALVLVSGRKQVLIVNYYFLELLIRGLESYQTLLQK